MKLHTILPALLAASLAAPVGASAQDDCSCPRPGMIGVVLDGTAEGARIVDVRRGSAAERAGLREGDVVVTVNGAPVPERVPRLPAGLQAGDTVRLRVSRDGADREVVVVAMPRPDSREMGARVRGPGEHRTIVVHADSLQRPLHALTVRIDSLQHRLRGMDSTGFRVRLDSMVRVLGDSAGVLLERMPSVRVDVHGREMEALAREGSLRALEARTFYLDAGRRAAAGAELAPMNEGLARYFGGQRTGALVTQVGPGTPAERAGLEPGDVIVRAAGEDVATPEDVRRHLSARGGSLPLEVVREGRRREITLSWEGREEREEREERVFRRERN